jgi:acetylornithine deacetylase/succinyl-diaminopimelate desuccinylase-like protein
MRNEASEILAELVASPSVHPDADAGGTEVGERRMGEWLERFLRRLGAKVRRDELAPGRDTIIAEFPGPDGAPTVVFAPHQDTVGVAGMTVRPFELTRNGDRLHGRGACDTKGPMAALLAALADWVEAGGPKRSSVKWVVAATAGEEQGSLGAEALLSRGFRADFAIALEPTDLRVVHSAKGLWRAWIEHDGVAAHASKPALGSNAIYSLLDLAVELRDRVAPEVASYRSPDLGAASLCLSIMQGGRELNLVPDHARLGLDVRTVPGLDGDTMKAMIEARFRRYAPAAKLKVHRQAPFFLTSREHFLARHLLRVARGAATADWLCDANIFAASGIPSVAFGPGSIEQAHTCDEFILESELHAGQVAFRRLLENDDGAL